MEVEAEDDDEEPNYGADTMSIAGGAEKLASGELVFASDPKVLLHLDDDWPSL